MKWIIGFFAAIGIAVVIQAKVPHWWTQGLVVNSYTIPVAWFCFVALVIALCNIKSS
jgi:Na+/proline symporter